MQDAILYLNGSSGGEIWMRHSGCFRMSLLCVRVSCRLSSCQLWFHLQYMRRHGLQLVYCVIYICAFPTLQARVARAGRRAQWKKKVHLKLPKCMALFDIACKDTRPACVKRKKSRQDQQTFRVIFVYCYLIIYSLLGTRFSKLMLASGCACMGSDRQLISSWD